jgi:probable HAF family extracellular repeat protein
MPRSGLCHPRQLCALLAFAMPLLASANPRYAVTAIAGQDSYARGMNNLGQVVGALAAADTYHAFVYANGKLTDLGDFGGDSSTAYAINDLGQVVGTAFASATDPARGFLYSGGVMSAVQNGGATFAYGINNAGTVVGTMTVTTAEGDFFPHAYTYANAAFTDLGTLPIGDGSRAFAINGHGDVVGAAASTFNGPPNFPEDPFVYRNGAMSDLGNLGGVFSAATAINDAGQIVGYVGVEYVEGSDDIYPRSAFLYEGSVLHRLGSLALDRSSSAYGINKLGQIVGAADLADGTAHAFLYEDGAMIDLNTLVDPASGWTIREASAINDLQQIAGTACKGDICQAVRLDLVSAVPEPAAYAMLLAGLGLGWRRVSRRTLRRAFRPPAGRRPG